MFLNYYDRGNFGKSLYPTLPFASTRFVDGEAINFINVAGLTDITQQTAIINLVADLKNYGIWDKMKAIYPFVGGTAATHKWNLKDPQDTDAAFRIVFLGGWTHSSNGALPNGTNGYADTKCADTNFSNNNISFGLYSRTNIAEAGYDMGIYLTGTANGSWIQLRRNVANALYTGVQQDASGEINVASTNSQGLFQSTKNGNDTVVTNANGAEVVNAARTTKNATGATFYLAALNNNGPAIGGYSSKQIAFAFIGSGLNIGNQRDYYAAVQAYQTTLGRQV